MFDNNIGNAIISMNNAIKFALFILIIVFIKRY